MSSGQPSSQGRKRGSIPTKNTKSTSDNTKSTGPYDRNFQQKLINGGVFPCGYEYPDGQEPAKPVNLEEIKQRLARPRPSLSPSIFSDEAHKEFVRADIHARKEIQVMTSVIPTITGIIQDLRGVSGGVPFTHLNNLTDDILTPGNPDLYYGARPEDLDKRILKELHCLIVPSTPEDLPITPNFFLAVKGPEGSHAVAQRQASYDGALGARAMHAIHSYGQDTPVYDNRAFTITSIYHHGTLQMYTSHLTQPTYPGDRPRYFTNRLKGWYITSDPESFREGVTWFRNAIDWTMEQRDIAIARANERVKDVYAAALAANVSDFSLVNSLARDASPETDGREPLTQESQTSLNEDSDPESSTDELASSSRPRTKRSGNRSKQPQTQRKRRITDGPSDAGD
ncbi:hypothetical protein MMC19_000202 [Ptychographa xylographoides]|nr:hypothetical protein [Ptychographa xylographoides]